MTMTKNEHGPQPGPFGSAADPSSARETVEQMVNAGLFDSLFQQIDTGSGPQ